MEPANLRPDDDPIEALLRRALPPEVPDAGFSARVLAALPPPSRRSLPWRQILLCAAGAAAGAAAALATGHSLQLALPTDAELAAAAQGAAQALSRPANALTVLIAAAALLYAWRGGEWELSG
ncbi:MAG TPA: hypothetical protein VHC86_03545 [Opitutaceae bacterium]|nr:hypothetical protein [Opitutaceae bacterium]